MTPRYPHPIRIQSNTPSQDVAGQPIESWSTFWDGWARVEDDSGQEVISDPVEGVLTTSVEMPFTRTGRIPQPTDRVLYGENKVTRTLNVEAVRRLGTGRRKLMLTVTEVQDG